MLMHFAIGIPHQLQRECFFNFIPIEHFCVHNAQHPFCLQSMVPELTGYLQCEEQVR